MGKEKSNKVRIVLLIFLISMISCVNKYEKHLSDILCVSEVSVISSKRYESNAIGEWYVVEKYVLANSVVDWTGWHSLSEHSSLKAVVLESASYLSNNSLVQEYEKCCNNDAGYFKIIMQDTLQLHNDFFEQTVVVIDTTTNALFICNYHY